jgi:hypothetical protein
VEGEKERERGRERGERGRERERAKNMKSLWKDRRQVVFIESTERVQ